MIFLLTIVLLDNFSIQDKSTEGGFSLEIISSEHTKLMAMVNSTNSSDVNLRKRKGKDMTIRNFIFNYPHLPKYLTSLR